MPTPGEWLLAEEAVEINEGRPTVRVTVRNTGDRAVQIGSHYHFFEVNRVLDFDRERAFGMRLNVPAGSATRFEPGDEQEVELIAFGGTHRVLGFQGLVDGSATARGNKASALARARRLGLLGVSAEHDDVRGEE